MPHRRSARLLCSLFLSTAILTHSPNPCPATDLRPEQVPLFKLRARVVSAGGKASAGTEQKFRYDLGSVTGGSQADGWSEWLHFDRPQAEANLKGYPAMYMKLWPVVVRLNVTAGAADPTRIEAELKFDEGGPTFPLSGELFGPSLGLNIWRDESQQPQAATMAVYNQRYWKVLEGLQIPADQRPKHFPIVDRFIGGDDDRIDWREGIEHLAAAGFSGIMLPPAKAPRELLLSTGLKRTAWAVYNPPGYAFDYAAEAAPDKVTEWARAQAKPYLDAGYEPRAMSLFAMSDEPGWYYPDMYQKLRDNPAGLTRFREYIRSQGLQPADVGAPSWEDVLPLGRSGAGDLPSRRRFYWTQRFFAWDSARHLANSTRALEEAFYPGMPIFTNWNFFSGRLYVPGPVANNGAKQDPDAAMGGHDWFEYGKLRGATMLWTEDWFGDSQAYQWSFYCARLRSAAQRGGIEFGGYVIPRTAGERRDGIVQKILSVVGHGGKAVKYFVFGPEYVFPGNCYSENAQVLRKMAEAHTLIAKAESVLWPGRTPRPQVAILAPRSAELWDAKGVPLPNQIQDATNNHLNNSTVDYMAEVFDLYLALQHANIPVDFVAEDDLSSDGLKAYRVLYVTEPNVPAEGQEGLVAWVKAGGTLVTVSGAAARDRYDDPCDVLTRGTGLGEQPRERLLMASLQSLATTGKGDGEHGAFTAIGVRGKLNDTLVVDGATVHAKFEDGAPAVVSRAVEKGRAIHFAWLPGISYARSTSTTHDKLPTGFSAALRSWITFPVESAEVIPPVKLSQPMVESPLLLSDAGAAVTLLNWTGEPIDALQVDLRLPFAVKSVESVRHGVIEFRKEGERVMFAVPLEAADIVVIRP